MSNPFALRFRRADRVYGVHILDESAGAGEALGPGISHDDERWAANHKFAAING
jgi:hypothetical protein